jgi:ubiquinone/menaquinone biosynthesis C-methylase UbiE
MMHQIMRQTFNSDFASVNCVDLACHEGYFSFKLAQMGCKNVLGIDARKKHIDDAMFLNQIYGHANVRFLEGDVQGGISTSEQFDFVLMFGILYHLENPIGALRLAYRLTRVVCLIETQVAPNLSGITDWGAYNCPKEIVGSFAIVDEAAEVLADNLEANLSAITIFPSLAGLLWILKRIGFSRTEIVCVPVGGYEQLRSGKRVMIAAYR